MIVCQTGSAKGGAAPDGGTGNDLLMIPRQVWFSIVTPVLTWCDRLMTTTRAWTLRPKGETVAHQQACASRAYYRHVAAGLFGPLLGLVMFGAGANELAVGSVAPEFRLLDQSGQPHSLADYRGRWVVLYFYPKDDTPGCTKEACAFRDDIRRFRQLQVALLGVSLDSVDSHRDFAGKYSLPFPLLADPGAEVARAYGALWSLGPIRFARRHSFIIDPQGRIARIYRSVTPGSHSDEVIQDLVGLGAGGD
jgi:peroxiredoxin Q/BCP